MFPLTDFNTYMMGVINITPNSFSDGGINNSPLNFKNHYDHLFTQGAHLIDIGAESTAPFNDPIGELEELKRFEEIAFQALDKKNLEDAIVSIDTYRPRVFEEVYRRLKEINPDAKIIWNDVSGVIDNSLIDLLNKYSDFLYVYSHTEVNDRVHTSNHMSQLLNCDDSETVKRLREYFNKGLEVFRSNGHDNRVILDPCFGFSKTYEQNIYLLDNLKDLITDRLLDFPWLIGISRKSFLQKKLGVDLKTEKGLKAVEKLQEKTLISLSKQIPFKKLIIRLHDPKVFHHMIKSIQSL